MALQILASFIYNLVEQSWIISTILTKYFLVLVLFKAFQDGDRSLDRVSEKLVDYSDIFVTLVVFLGLAGMLIGLEIQPVARVFSEIIALSYFAFLFWKY